MIDVLSKEIFFEWYRPYLVIQIVIIGLIIIGIIIITINNNTRDQTINRIYDKVLIQEDEIKYLRQKNDDLNKEINSFIRNQNKI